MFRLLAQRAILTAVAAILGLLFSAVACNAVAGPFAPGTIAWKTDTSPPWNSGKWGEFSDWHEFCVEAPANTEIVSHTFHLEGDRTCGSWSVCKQTASSPTKVCWAARLQGHNEREWLRGAFGNTDEGRRESKGVIVFQYRYL